VVAPERVPWWRRLFRRKPKQFAAGERAGRMRIDAKGGLRSGMKLMTIVRSLLALVVILGVVGYVGVPSVQKFVNEATGGGPTAILERIRQFIAPQLKREPPVSYEASDEVPEHGVKLLFDLNTATQWEADGANPTVTVQFKAPVDLGGIIIHSGAGKDFVDYRRPSKLELRFPDGTTTTLELDDINKAQDLRFDAGGVDEVVVRVAETNGPADAPVVISELEFFRKG
jgi:hypothetical protein